MRHGYIRLSRLLDKLNCFELNTQHKLLFSHNYSYKRSASFCFVL